MNPHGPLRGRFPVMLVAMCAAVWCLVHVHAAAAQDHHEGVAPTPVELDTGRLQVGHRDYTRYDTPGACYQAVVALQRLSARTGVLDTMSFTTAHDTLPVVARQAALRCGAAFTVQSTAPRDLRDLYRLSLAMGRDDQARAVLERAMSLAPTVPEKGQFLWHAVADNLGATPCLIARVDSILRRLDALGPAAHLARMFAHRARLEYAWATFDRPVIRREIEAIYAVLPLFDTDELDTWPTVGALYDAAVAVTQYDSGPRVLAPLLDRIRPYAVRIHRGRESAVLASYALGIEWRVKLSELTIPPLTGGTWFPTSGANHYPVAGRPLLVVSVDHSCGARCHPAYAEIARLRQRYAASGLDVVLVSGTSGFMQGAGVQTPAQETESIRHYFLDYLHLDVALRVTETSFRLVPPDDHREVIVPPPATVWDQYLTNGAGVLLDPSGKPVWMGVFMANDEVVAHRAYAEVEAYLARFMTPRS